MPSAQKKEKKLKAYVTNQKLANQLTLISYLQCASCNEVAQLAGNIRIKRIVSRHWPMRSAAKILKLENTAVNYTYFLPREL